MIITAGSMNRENNAVTLQVKSLVKEEFPGLLRMKRAKPESRELSFIFGARVIRRILVDAARSRVRQRRAPKPMSDLPPNRFPVTAAGATISNPTTTFIWTAGTGADVYWLDAGPTVGSGASPTAC